MREIIQNIYILCSSPNIWKKTPLFHSPVFNSYFGLNMLFSGTFFLWFPVVPLVLSLVSLQFPLNCFQYIDTRILTFCHFDLLNIAVFFSFLFFFLALLSLISLRKELSLLSSRMVKSWPINPKSPQVKSQPSLFLFSLLLVRSLLSLFLRWKNRGLKKPFLFLSTDGHS